MVLSTSKYLYNLYIYINVAYLPSLYLVGKKCKNISMETSSQVHERESEIEYKVDHEKTKEPKELQEKEAHTANQKLKLSTKLGRLPRVWPIKKPSIIVYKVDHEETKEPKELQEKEAQTANQKFKLSTKLDRLPRVQPIKRRSIIKGMKISKGIFMSSQHSINEFKNCLQNWSWSKFKSKLCFSPVKCFVMFRIFHFLPWPRANFEGNF